MTALLVGAAIIAAIVIVIVVLTIAARRRGYSGMGGDTVVRCRRGHLFTTIWVPGASFKSVRLGCGGSNTAPLAITGRSSPQSERRRADRRGEAG